MALALRIYSSPHAAGALVPGELGEAVAAAGLSCKGFSSAQEAAQACLSAAPNTWQAVIFIVGNQVEYEAVLPELLTLDPRTFSIVYGQYTADHVVRRLRCFENGVRMVSCSLHHIRLVLNKLVQQNYTGGTLVCPTCGFKGLNEDQLHLHHELHHAVDPNHRAVCPVCGISARNFALHIHNEHGPLDNREPPHAPYAAFAWVVCRRPSDGKFLLVNEPAGISRGLPRYWLPAGRVDIGESIIAAGEREALEEAGIHVRVQGILLFMVSKLCSSHACPRLVFYAEPLDDSEEPKSVPDWESAGALWVSPEDLQELSPNDYRSDDPAVLFPGVASGKFKSLSIDTKAFRQFDALIQRLTKGGKEDGQFMDAWVALKDTYPSRAFSDH